MSGTRLITKKTSADFEKMKIAGRCVAEMHARTREAAAPGVTTGDLDAIAREVLNEWDCASSFLGYGSPQHPFPGVICTSPNSVIVHGIPGDYTLADGDIISIDADGERKVEAPGYASRSPGTMHGPVRSDGGCLILEFNWYEENEAAS